LTKTMHDEQLMNGLLQNAICELFYRNMLEKFSKVFIYIIIRPGSSIPSQ